MPRTIHHISKRLTIEECWTVEPTPQLQHVKVTSLDGREASAVIDYADVDAASVRLLQINYDRLAQMRLKRRLKEADLK